MVKKKIVKKEVEKINSNACPICENRLKLRNELDATASKRDKPEDAREAMRTDSIDCVSMKVSQEGYTSRLKECCDGVVGSVTDSFVEDGKGEHHHMCGKCSKRFPERGSFDGDFVNDDLRRAR